MRGAAVSRPANGRPRLWDTLYSACAGKAQCRDWARLFACPALFGKRMEYRLKDISSPDKEQRRRLLALWEASVRASHDFLAESDIQALKPLVDSAFAQVERLICLEGVSRRPLAFLGAHAGKVEMLFVDPGARGSGLGRGLMQYAIECLGARLVDVNEQNPRARGFYERMGFRVIGRSALDGQGRPFPLLHMELCAEGDVFPKKN